MLLELQPSDMASDLESVDAALLALLAALSLAGPDVDARDLLAAHWPSHKGRPPKASLRIVLALSPEQRRELYEAVESDLTFADHLDDSGFVFRFPDLPDITRRAGTDLLVSMYSDVLSKGGFARHCGSGEITRTTLEAGFWRSNPELAVCPACLVSVLERPAAGRSALHLDHYLPKAVYAPLAVHRLNLVPVCATCNVAMKGGKDPLRLADQPRRSLRSIWFPYRRPGLHEAELRFDPSRRQASVVSLDGLRAEPVARERAFLFDQLFELSERWSNLLGPVHNSIRSFLQDQRPGEPCSRSVIADELLRFARWKEAMVAIQDRAHLEASYARWLADDSVALDAFVADVADPSP